MGVNAVAWAAGVRNSAVGNGAIAVLNAGRTNDPTPAQPPIRNRMSIARLRIAISPLSAVEVYLQISENERKPACNLDLGRSAGFS
jgi:hypothetical protein